MSMQSKKSCIKMLYFFKFGTVKFLIQLGWSHTSNKMEFQKLSHAFN